MALPYRFMPPIIFPSLCRRGKAAEFGALYLAGGPGVDWMGKPHCGAPRLGGKDERKHAMELACDTLKLALKRLEEEGLPTFTSAPKPWERSTKGTLEEVIAFCLLDERLIPALILATFTPGRRTVKVPSHRPDSDTLHNQLGRQRAAIFTLTFQNRIHRKGGAAPPHLEDPSFGPIFPLGPSTAGAQAQPHHHLRVGRYTGKRCHCHVGAV